MSVKVFFDTNILIYAFAHDDSRSDTAEAALARGGTISVQILNEFVAVARRKLAMPWEEVLEALAAIRTLVCPPCHLTSRRTNWPSRSQCNTETAFAAQWS